MTAFSGGRALGARAPSRSRLVIRRLRHMPRFWIGCGFFALIAAWAIFGNTINIYGPADQDVYALNSAPSAEHWFGTDNVGLDLYARVVEGLRRSLLIGLFAGLISTTMAALVGSLAGYLGGRAEMALVWVINFMLVLPAFYVLLILAPALANLSWVAIIVVIGFTTWMITAQVVRSQTKALRNLDYVMAARFMGVGTGTILVRHIIPNVASLLIVDATLGVVGGILAETGLSYFGLGVQPPQVSLGTLLQAGTPAAVTRPWLFAFPALALVLTLTAVSLMADALRDAFDPTSGAHRG